MLFAKPTIKRYGIAQNGKLFCLLCREPDLSVQWFEDEQALLSALPAKAEIVYSLPHQHIWRKVLFLNEQYRKRDLHPQILRILSQELPLSIEEIRFDYHIQKIPSGIRLALFAIRNTFSTVLQSEKTIWDCELHCIARALLHLNQQSIENIEQFYFPFNGQFFNFQTDGVHFCSTAEPEKVLSADQLEIPADKQSLYLSALGASLWNGTASI